MSLLDTSDMRDLCVDRQLELKLGGVTATDPMNSDIVGSRALQWWLVLCRPVERTRAAV